METPIQKLIEEFKLKLEKQEEITSFGQGKKQVYQQIINDLEDSLEEEKSTIINAYEYPSYNSSGEEYYNETFKK